LYHFFNQNYNVISYCYRLLYVYGTVYKGTYEYEIILSKKKVNYGAHKMTRL